MALIAAKRVQFLNKSKFKNENHALKRVLFEICEQFETSDEEDTHEDANDFYAPCRVDEILDDAAASDITLPQVDEIADNLFASSQNEPELRLEDCLRDF